MVVGSENTEEEGERGNGFGLLLRWLGKEGTGGGGELSKGWFVIEFKRPGPGRRKRPVRVRSSSLSVKPKSSSSSSTSDAIVV